jgi:hypothetical protein
MDAYIRFQTQLRCRLTARPAGIFVAAGRVDDQETLHDASRGRLREVLDWFNDNLTVPALDTSDWRCLFWFRSTSQPVIRRLWKLAYLLEDEGVFVTKVRTTEPGTIVYGDEHQVAAKPRRKKHVCRV